MYSPPRRTLLQVPRPGRCWIEGSTELALQDSADLPPGTFTTVPPDFVKMSSAIHAQAGHVRRRANESAAY
jgi:hypothetical protein